MNWKVLLVVVCVSISFSARFYSSELDSTHQQFQPFADFTFKSASFVFGDRVYVFINMKSKIGQIHHQFGNFKRNSSSYLGLLLLLCGDIECNPGPSQCDICSKVVRMRDNALQCDNCEKWVHAKCCHIPVTEYRELANSSEDWFCPDCISPCGICS